MTLVDKKFVFNFHGLCERLSTLSIRIDWHEITFWLNGTARSLQQPTKHSNNMNGTMSFRSGYTIWTCRLADMAAGERDNATARYKVWRFAIIRRLGYCDEFQFGQIELFYSWHFRGICGILSSRDWKINRCWWRAAGAAVNVRKWHSPCSIATLPVLSSAWP